MRVALKFDENYHAADGAIIDYRKSHLWDPLPVGETASDLRSFLQTLTERDDAHNDCFHYVSPNTDVLGWVLERATGSRYADLVSALLWRSEEHTSELQSLMRISYAVFCLQTKK